MSDSMPSPTPDMATWLMIIDMQRIFGEPVSEWVTPDYASASAGIQRLLGAFDPVSASRGSWRPSSRQASGSTTTRSGPLHSTR